MPFEDYEPIGGLRLVPIEPGVVSIGKTGVMTFHRSDMARIGVTDAVAVMIDKTTLRVGFKRPRLDRPSLKVHRDDSAKRQHPRDRVHLAGALSALGLECEPVAGRFKLHFHNDELAFIVLTETEDLDELGEEES